MPGVRAADNIRSIHSCPQVSTPGYGTAWTCSLAEPSVVALLVRTAGGEPQQQRRARSLCRSKGELIMGKGTRKLID